MITTQPSIPDPFDTYLETRSLDQLQRLLEWAADAQCGRSKSKVAPPWGSGLPYYAHEKIAKRIAAIQGGVVREEDRRDLLAEIDALKARVAQLEAKS